ncbi:hypothetical protein FisN_2Lh085 [Fistulifera solaris]|uniref:Uncharacterized protein n=1 Tax=Fistulifera solaris TaxID=1519565 RepID=A0A1Z5JX59_FISSO|nr:hypothetical protein FisN_2Lh085 [Fistulifera solaris]|eukprot:GAX18442.1 hypothetical protein FisN_2Lh085 [Fistulifera solaris]
MAKRTLLIFLLLVASSMQTTNALNDDADFVGYMENLEKMERDRERINKMLEEHELWRQTTWGGYAVRQVQALGKHFEPFFLAVSDALNDGGSEPTRLLILITIRIIVISICIGMIYAVGSIINMITGKEIIIEETVVVDDAPSKSNETHKKEDKRRGAREKKKAN